MHLFFDFCLIVAISRNALAQNATASALLPRCPPNEVWNHCGPDPCMATCDRPAQFCTGLCNPAEAQCICQRGFVRHNGRCIPRSECPPKPCQDPNQIRTACGEFCTCDEFIRFSFSTGNAECPRVCAETSINGDLPCVCKPGYIFDVSANGRCIAKDQCNPACPSNSVRQYCGRICTCDEFKRTRRCREQCSDATGGKPLCYCRNGFVFDRSQNGQCISERQCLGQSTSCVDSDSRCSYWARNGECRRNPTWMNSNCRLSCAPECSGEHDESCSDENRNCGRWAARGECGRNPDYMHWRCRKSCGDCGGSGIAPAIAAGHGVGSGGGAGVAPPAPDAGDYPSNESAA